MNEAPNPSPNKDSQDTDVSSDAPATPPSPSTGQLVLKSAKVQGTAAFGKGIALMQLIADSPENPTKQDLLKRSGIPRQTLHRLLKALEAEELIEYTDDNTYRLGARMFLFARRAVEQNDVIQHSEHELRKLRDRTTETIHLAVLSGQHMVYILKEDSPKSLRLVTRIGDHVPLHASAIGKSLVAFLPENRQQKILEHLEMPKITDFTITDRTRLLEEIEGIKQRGYSIAIQESEMDVKCFGAPIYDHRGVPVAGISVSVPLFRLEQDENARYIQPLLETCQLISQRLESV